MSKFDPINKSSRGNCLFQNAEFLAHMLLELSCSLWVSPGVTLSEDTAEKGPDPSTMAISRLTQALPPSKEEYVTSLIH